MKPLQSLRGVTRLPLLDSQGQLIYERGYHADSGWYSDPNIEPQKLVEPLGSAELKRRWRLLFNSYFCEFPGFEGKTRQRIRRSLLRWLLSVAQGFFPLFILDGCQPGTGKTTLCNAASVIAFGHKLQPLAYPSRHEELEKVLQSAVQSRVHVLCFDNVDQPIGGAVLDALLTADEGSSFRRMHTQSLAQSDHQPIFIANGNSVRVHGDTFRRTLRFGLKSVGCGADQRGPFGLSLYVDALAESREEWMRLIIGVALDFEEPTLTARTQKMG